MKALEDDYHQRVSDFETLNVRASHQDYYTKAIVDALFLLMIFMLIAWFMFQATAENVAFILPIISLLLFGINRMVTVVSRASSLAQFDLILQKLNTFDQELTKDLADQKRPVEKNSLSFEKQLEVKNLTFHYDQLNENGYQLGPLDFSIQKGELVFCGRRKWQREINLFENNYPIV